MKKQKGNEHETESVCDCTVCMSDGNGHAVCVKCGNVVMQFEEEKGASIASSGVDRYDQ